MIADTGIAEPLAQLVGNQFSVCPCRRHTINESADIFGEIVVTVFREQTGNGAPTVLRNHHGYRPRPTGHTPV